ncbi:glycine cleavage system protein GcvH, partial [Simkania negevensis]|nr:glycine cleavage system protein GcvH [Simkania negevensis]
MKFTESHEWIDEDEGRIGISDYAQSELGEIVYVELPEVGSHVDKGDEVVVLESTKAAADVYSPASGTIVEVNNDLADSPDLVNTNPYGTGWLLQIKLDDAEEFNDMMDEKSYETFITK